MDTQVTQARPEAPREGDDLDAWHDEIGRYVESAALALSRKLRAARGTRRRADVAQAIGVHENTVAKFERGEAVPSAFDLIRLALLYDIQVSDLLPCQPLGTREIALSDEAQEVEDHVLVPFFDIRASAGSSAFVGTDNVRVMRPFGSDYIRRELGVSHNKLAIVPVAGPSMEPMIHSGDVILIDRNDVEIAVEGPHLVRVDGYMVVKIAERRPGGMVRLSSVNPSFEPFEISLSGPGDFQVLGRVRWAGITFK